MRNILEWNINENNLYIYVGSDDINKKIEWEIENTLINSRKNYLN